MKMERGMPAKSQAEAEPPWAIPTKVVKRTMTKTSSRDAPARMSWGMRLSVPSPSSISCTILGTTTAGETAPSTAPSRAASSRVTPSSRGAKRVTAPISKRAGRKERRRAGRPTACKSLRSRERPALMRMTISAICRRSAETARIEPSRRARA